MSHLHWMPLYIGDELATTSHLSAEEFGAYISLQMYLWQHGRLPEDESRIARVARVEADRWSSVGKAIAPLFADGWRLPRLELRRTEAEEKHKSLSENGKKGGRPRKQEKADEKPGFNSALSEQKAWPKQSQSHPQSDSQKQSSSTAHSTADTWALENERGTYTHARAKVPIADCEEDAIAFLERRGVFPGDYDDLSEKMMRGELLWSDLPGTTE